MTLSRLIAGPLAAACTNVARATLTSAAYLGAALVSVAPAQAIPPSASPSVNGAAIARAVGGPVVGCLGDSTCAAGVGNTPPGSPYYASSYFMGTSANAYLGWAMAASNNGIVADIVNSGYPGSPGGLLKVKPATPGACPPNSVLTVTPTTTPPGSPSNLPSSFTVPINGAGQADTTTWIYPSNAGSGYTSQPAYSFSGSAGACATNPTFNYALSGAGDWGVPGDTTDGALARVPDVCNSPAKPDFIYLPIGTNDIPAGRSFASITSNIAAIVSGLQACNVRPILFGITPRNIGVSGWTATMDKLRLRVNRWEMSLAQQSASSGQPPILYADLDHLETDPSQSGATIGNPLPSVPYDGLHPGPSGGFFGGLVLANVLRPYTSPILYQPNSQSDVYDAANNPGGNLIGTMGLMLGANAGASGPCAAGTTPLSWQVTTSGTGTVTATCSIESPRTDGLPGRRAVIAYSNSGGGTAEKLIFGEYNNVIASLTLGTDKIYATANVDVGNMQNVEYVGCQLLETAPILQSSTMLNSGAVGPTIPLPNSTQIALLQEARILPDFGLSSPGSFKIPCRTPPITTQANATSYSFVVTVLGNSSATPYTIILKVSDVDIRKVTP